MNSNLETYSNILNNPPHDDSIPCLTESTEDKDFLMRCTIIQESFLRMSQTTKTRFVMNFIKEIDSLEVINHFLNCASNIKKLSSYVNDERLTNFLYDNTVEDHDRCLDSKVLEKSIKEDLHWWRTLTATQKVSVLTCLIRLAGGRIPIKCHNKLMEKYNNFMHKNAEDHFFQFVEQKRSTYSSKERVDFTVREQYDEANPANSEVKKLHGLWEDKINQYRIEIQKKSDLVQKNLIDEARAFIPVSTKTKSSETLKQKATGKKDQENQETVVKTESKTRTTEVNHVQLLPIWLIIKIFSYLDAKNLKTAQQVDFHWDFAAKILIEERKARTKLDKIQETLDSNIEEECLEGQTDNSNPEKFYEYTLGELNVLKGIKRGAANKKLTSKRKHYNKQFKPTLQQNCLLRMNDFYKLPLHCLDSYPRFFTTNVPKLYELSVSNNKDIDVYFQSKLRAKKNGKQIGSELSNLNSSYSASSELENRTTTN